jgi:hypothetical protein
MEEHPEDPLLVAARDLNIDIANPTPEDLERLAEKLGTQGDTLAHDLARRAHLRSVAGGVELIPYRARSPY